jgi:hypothetical protein
MIIRHRVNTARELRSVPAKYGVEIDLRVSEGEIVLAHDPFTPGESFESWLEDFFHGTLILNVKEDGLERYISEILKSKGIDDYFFLDQPFPTLRKSALENHPVALRLSENENPIEIGSLDIKWIWLDSFSGNWNYLAKHAVWLQSGEFRLCIVSPELQGRSLETESSVIVENFKNANLKIDAVCTKTPEIWEMLLS